MMARYPPPPRSEPSSNRCYPPGSTISTASHWMYAHSVTLNPSTVSPRPWIRPTSLVTNPLSTAG